MGIGISGFKDSCLISLYRPHPWMFLLFLEIREERLHCVCPFSILWSCSFSLSLVWKVQIYPFALLFGKLEKPGCCCIKMENWPVPGSQEIMAIAAERRTQWSSQSLIDQATDASSTFIVDMPLPPSSQHCWSLNHDVLTFKMVSCDPLWDGEETLELSWKAHHNSRYL